MNSNLVTTKDKSSQKEESTDFAFLIDNAIILTIYFKIKWKNEKTEEEKKGKKDKSAIS